MPPMTEYMRVTYQIKFQGYFCSAASCSKEICQRRSQKTFHLQRTRPPPTLYAGSTFRHPLDHLSQRATIPNPILSLPCLAVTQTHMLKNVASILSLNAALELKLYAIPQKVNPPSCRSAGRGRKNSHINNMHLGGRVYGSK